MKKQEKFNILVINPGSTSTKIGFFVNEQPQDVVNIHHEAEELSGFRSVLDQSDFRKKAIYDHLHKNYPEVHFHGVAARGGLIQPVPGGVYLVDKDMLEDLRNAAIQHASNLAAVIGQEIAKEYGVKAYIMDPVIVDEMDAVARYSGHPDIRRSPIFHALNQKEVARRYSLSMGKKYTSLNLIVCHIGGGISVGVHRRGKVVDVNNAITGEGPFTPERSGALPAMDMIKLIQSGAIDFPRALAMLQGKGGLVAYTGTSDVEEIQRRIRSGEKNLEEILDAFVYQIAKEIGAASAVLKGKVDGILITGGVAHDTRIVRKIKSYVSHIGQVAVYPGEHELSALASGVYRVLTGKEKVRNYAASIIKRP